MTASELGQLAVVSDLLSLELMRDGILLPGLFLNAKASIKDWPLYDAGLREARAAAEAKVRVEPGIEDSKRELVVEDAWMALLYAVAAVLADRVDSQIRTHLALPWSSYLAQIGGSDSSGADN